MLALLPPIAATIRAPRMAWRGGTFERHGDARSAADVIRFEQQQGRLLDLSGAFIAALSALHASALLWVTFKRSHAARYGPPQRVEIDTPAYVIGQDGAGGFLILFIDTDETDSLEFAPMAPIDRLEELRNEIKADANGLNDDIDGPTRPAQLRATMAEEPAPGGGKSTRSTYYDPNDNPALAAYAAAAVEPRPQRPDDHTPPSDAEVYADYEDPTAVTNEDVEAARPTDPTPSAYDSGPSPDEFEASINPHLDAAEDRAGEAPELEDYGEPMHQLEGAPRTPAPTDKTVDHYAELNAMTPKEGFQADLAAVAETRDVQGFAPAEREIVTPAEREPSPEHGGESFGGYALFSISVAGGKEQFEGLYTDHRDAMEQAREFPASREDALAQGQGSWGELHPITQELAADKAHELGDRLMSIDALYSSAKEIDGAMVAAAENEPGAVSFERVLDPAIQQQQAESSKEQEAVMRANAGEAPTGERVSVEEKLAAMLTTSREERAAMPEPANDVGQEQAASFGGRD